MRLSNDMEPADVTDAALVARAQAGERQAFSTLVRRHQATVYRVCYRILGDREDAEDAAQEALLRAYRKLDTFLGQSAFKTWLLRLTVNVSLNERARRKSLISLDGSQDDAYAAPDPEPGPEAELLRSEAAVQLNQALRLLNPNPEPP